MTNDEEIAMLKDALERAQRAIAEYIRYLHGGEMRGSYDGKPERDGLIKTLCVIRNTLARSEADHD